MSKLPSVHGSRKPRADSEQTRRAILDATLQILGEQGLASLTHRAVAKRAGVSLALTSYHFDSKENLVSEALDDAVHGTIGELDAAAAAMAGPGEPLTRALVAQRLADLTMSRLGDERLNVISVIELSLAAARRPALQATTAAWNAAYHQIVVGLLERCDVPDPEGAARLVVATLEGLVLLQLVESDPAFEPDVLRPAMARLLHSL